MPGAAIPSSARAFGRLEAGASSCGYAGERQQAEQRRRRALAPHHRAEVVVRMAETGSPRCSGRSLE